MVRFTSIRRLLAAFGLAGALVVGCVTPAQASVAKTRALAVQTRLAQLGYLPSGAISGAMDERTRQAVVAFQAWEGLERDGVASPAMLARAARPRPLPGSGSRIEVHLDRQVALLVHGNKVVRAIHVSSGAAATPTPTGDFRVYRKERESWSVPFRVWLPWASYFDLGIAFHGYPDVPAYPASHGCVRIPLTEASTVYAFARLGVPVRVVS
jgi:hypothetical protein